ncbi:hypothetical protein [Streptomyces sp. NPDC097619]|uniref:hypothetical protein n=1 Tax=Streptomyces sp. NPDC097619 TaxID=3157228 RepID=UPI0033235977
MDYAYAVKALPRPDDPQPEEPVAPPEPNPPREDDARPWAGDLYDEGDESDPAAAFAAFSGQSGEQAWLDKAEDGTLTGWLRDETGQVYRYADPDAWAIDVDDAGMAQTGGSGQGAVEPGAGPDGAEGAAEPAAAEPGEETGVEFATADDVVLPSESGPPEPGSEEPADEDEEDDDEGFPKGGKVPR